MEHYDGEFYTLRLFSPIEGEIYSLNSTEEGIHLTAYEMENYSSFIRDHMEGVGLLGKRNQKLMTYFNNAKRLHKPVSLSLDLEAYEEFLKLTKKNLKRFFPESFQERKVEIMEVLKNNNIKLQGVYLPGTKSYTSVPLLYLESYYQELEDGKKLEDVWQKIAQDYQKCQEAEISIDGISSREWDYETIKKSLTVYVRNAQENIDFLASCPHEIREDLALVYGFHVLVDGEKAGSAIINYDRLRWLGVSEEQLKQDAWENMKQSNPPCFLDLQDMLAKMYSDELGDVKAGSLEYLEDVDPNAMMYVLTNSN